VAGQSSGVFLLRLLDFLHQNDSEQCRRFEDNAARRSQRRRIKGFLPVSEDLYRRIAESLDDVLSLDDMQGRIMYISPAIQRLTGFSPGELMGQPGNHLIHPEDREPFDHLCTERPKQQGWGECVSRLRTREGAYRWIHCRARLLAPSEGQPAQLLRCSRDITEYRRREDEARQDQKLEAVGRLAGGVAHDFNNLLTIISGYTWLLLQAHGRGDQDYDALSEIHRAAERATSLTQQLLAFSRRQMLQPVVLDLNVVIQRLEEIFKRLVGPATLVRLNLYPALPQVKLDRGQIEQVLLDLAANARDAMPAGGQFLLTTSRVPPTGPEYSPGPGPGRTVCLTVRDTGCGMDEETLAHLFEPFFTTKEIGKARGLGLAAVHGIVNQLDGQIEVASAPGQGTTFTLTFPAAFPAAPPAPAQPGRTVLLVEDEYAVRGLARHVLQREGYTVLEASHGAEALKLHDGHNGPIDILVADVVMPQLNGLELARQLVKSHPHLRILFLSGYNQEGSALGQMIEGKRPVILAKPFLPADLVRSVQELLQEQSP
jgi:two-component system cell cycle sensor histidine kinase/response regulator CckA